MVVSSQVDLHPKKELQILVQSVVMASLWSSKEQRAQAIAIGIHERLMASIYVTDAWDVLNSQTGEETSAWPMGTYQAILLNVIFSLMTGNRDTSRSHPNRELPEPHHKILVAVVKSSLKRGMFSYPRMLAQYQKMDLAPDTAPHIWIGIEEAKRFALTLYHVWKMHCNTQVSNEHGADLLSLQDLQFSVPVSDYLWNAESVSELVRMVEEEKANGKQICDNEMNWIYTWSCST